MVKVKFHSKSFNPDEGLTYSVIAARYRGKWIFIKHRQRGSFEMPAGHIEEKETPEETAVRELREETGALDFKLFCVATYSVERDGKRGYGRLFFAEIETLGEIIDVSEVEEVIYSDELPYPLTYPDIQPRLFEKVLKYIQRSPS